MSLACKESRIPRQSAYDWRNDDPGFKENWDDAVEEGTDLLEDEGFRRAHQGVDEPVFYQGDVCGLVRKYSDTLLIFLLKARRPDKYKDRVENQLTGKDGKGFPALRVIIDGPETPPETGGGVSQ